MELFKPWHKQWVQNSKPFSSSVYLFSVPHVWLVTLRHLRLSSHHWAPYHWDINPTGTKGCSSTVSQYSKHRHKHTHKHKHSPTCHFPKTKEKEAANIFAALWGGGRVNVLLGWAWQTDVCACAVYREWRQGYHSVRQNALGSPSGHSCYHGTAKLQRLTAAPCPRREAANIN